MRELRIGVERVAVATQGADGEAVSVERLAEIRKRPGVLQHREFAVGVAGVVARSQLNRINTMALELVQDLFQGKLGQQRGEDADSQVDKTTSCDARFANVEATIEVSPYCQVTLS